MFKCVCACVCASCQRSTTPRGSRQAAQKLRVVRQTTVYVLCVCIYCVCVFIVCVFKCVCVHHVDAQQHHTGGRQAAHLLTLDFNSCM